MRCPPHLPSSMIRLQSSRLSSRRKAASQWRMCHLSHRPSHDHEITKPGEIRHARRASSGIVRSKRVKMERSTRCLPLLGSSSAQPRNPWRPTPKSDNGNLRLAAFQVLRINNRGENVLSCLLCLMAMARDKDSSEGEMPSTAVVSVVLVSYLSRHATSIMHRMTSAER